ncbi:nitroreductase family protein [Mycoplasmatota bacterium]|nr:nitroreductase family protein [Mycoplasmatota bacterium]
MLLDLLRKRTSIRNFTGGDIKDEIIDYILEAGRLSPSGGNEQPWKFGVITDKNLIKKISEIAYHQKWIESASFLIVLCTCIIEAECGGRDIQKSRFPELSKTIDSMNNEIYSCLNLEEHQTKIPGTHMVLAALEHGITSTWVSYFDVNKVSSLLNLPKSIIASEIIVFGYPIKKKEPLIKKNIEEIVFYNKFK